MVVRSGALQRGAKPQCSAGMIQDPHHGEGEGCPAAGNASSDVREGQH